MLDKRKFYINGQWVDPSNKNDLEVINPSDESVCAIISLGSQEDTDAAVFSCKSSITNVVKLIKRRKNCFAGKALRYISKKNG